MAQQVQIDQFSCFPREKADLCYNAAMYIQKECEMASQFKADHEMLQLDSLEISSTRGGSGGSQHKLQFGRTPQPPSWDDLEVPAAQNQNSYAPQHNQRYQYQKPQSWASQQPQSWAAPEPQPQDANDVFSSMGHWCGEAMGMPDRRRYGQQQYGRANQFNPALPGDSDVFSNVGMFDVSQMNQMSQMKPQKHQQQYQQQYQQHQYHHQQQQRSPKNETMTMDLMAPTPPPTFQPYPPRAQSLSSPTASSMTSSDQTSSEEPNAWKSLVLLLNQKPSRSPSLVSAGTKSPTETENFGHWISTDLQ